MGIGDVIGVVLGVLGQLMWLGFIGYSAVRIYKHHNRTEDEWNGPYQGPK